MIRSLKLIPKKLTYNRFFRDHMHLSWNAKEMVQALTMCLLSSRSCVRIAAGSRKKKEKNLLLFFFLVGGKIKKVLNIVPLFLCADKRTRTVTAFATRS